MWSKLDYIHMNPVSAGIVIKIEDYIYSSASNYVNGAGGIIEVELLEIPKIYVLKPSSFDKYFSQ